MSYFKFEQSSEHLLQYRPDVLKRQRAELVLLEEVVEVLLQHLEHEARVRAVLEALVRADEVELVRRLLREAREDRHLRENGAIRNEIKKTSCIENKHITYQATNF